MRRFAVLAIAALIPGCGSGNTEEAATLATVAATMPSPAPKVLLIGLDGADWNVARPLMAAGRLPVLSSLVEEGASGDLRSIEPMISPALWTSVMTGVVPQRHGIRDFVFKLPGTDEQPIVNATIRERLALWNILSGLGLKVGIVDWYATWPAEPVNGFIVSDRIKTMGLESEGVVYPADDSLRAVLTDPPPLERFAALDRLRRVAEPQPPGLEKALREDLYRFRIAKELYRTHHPDFFAFYLKGLDAVGHFYWKHFAPDEGLFGPSDPAEVEQLGSIIPDYYELCDQLLGDFLKGVDEQTTVLVISDHGFRAFARPDSLIFDLDRLFEAMGLLEFEDPTLAGDRAQREIRMAATRAYTHEGTMIVSAFGSRDRPVYLNVAGRDPEGVIARERWLDERDAIKSRLESLHTDLDSPLFSRVEINEAASRPGRQEPDLYLRVNPRIAFDYEVLVDGTPYSLFDVFFWEYGNISGTHRTEGIFVARGPRVRRGIEIREAGLLDIAPTVLRLVGVPAPEDLDGRALSQLFSSSVVASGLRVASYETLIERERATLGEAPIDEEYRERLRALGYVQ